MAEILIVGAGMAGAVHARRLADAGFDVHVIDQRDHVGGNCFDSVDPATGIRVHRYGPHLFHTSNMRVVDWLGQFTDWVPYEHRVVARLESGRLVPMPINADTIAAVLDRPVDTPAEAEAMLASLARPRGKVESAEDHLLGLVGPQLTELFFGRYTRKMWGQDLAEMDAAVVRRLKIRTDREDRYFPGDSFQALPARGYTAMFEAMLDHPRIRLSLSTAFEHRMLDECLHCFNAMPIDVFFECRHGALPYRSIRFHTTRHPAAAAPGHATVNYTDSGPFTRETWWHELPRHGGDATVLRTVEEPCDYRDNRMERYYPVKASDGRYDRLYQRYCAEAAQVRNLTFIGRCGTYQYLDMHQVVNQALMGTEAWLARAAA
ncbi:NAD(P)-binding protein [Rhodobacteraceae bacterium 2CG4]|uniref:NAD(P)-binding protein n=1 Tax=Halovulum marinum TaxID=2662447 RepID=A0A6L5YWZ8_9RHOB|nr:UDP-galactopyranose mutase [Halovulum marinum]MSU88727.1 NAD(P)-binding protein [Halovulum marinum]